MHENVVRLKAVSLALKGLKQTYVFVGGATVALYAAHPELTDEIRPTDDVDVIIELASYSGYAELDERLRSLGFKNDVDSGIICRYTIQGIIVDIIPTDAAVMGFSNKWYHDGFKNAITHAIDSETSIKIFSMPYFIASKWEAFKGRGRNDYRFSKDFEDIVYVFENADDFEDQIKNAPQQLIAYLKTEFSKVIDSDDFEEGLHAHLSGGYGGIDANFIMLRLRSALNINS